MGFVIDKEGNYLPVLGETTGGGGGGGTSDHSQLSNLDYAHAGHTGFMSSADYISGDTVINVKTDGTGDYTTIKDAFDSLTGKWSDGEITIQLGTGSFDIETYRLYGEKCNIPKINIIGNGTVNTTVNYINPQAGTPFLYLSNQFAYIKDIAFVCATGTKSTDYRGVLSWKNAYVMVESCTFNGISHGVWGFRGGQADFQTTSFYNSRRAVSAEGGGVVNIGWATSGTFENVETALYVNGGGTIKGGNNTFTFTSVTNKVSQTPGAATDSGWIAVSNSGLT